MDDLLDYLKKNKEIAKKVWAYIKKLKEKD